MTRHVMVIAMACCCGSAVPAVADDFEVVVAVKSGDEQIHSQRTEIAPSDQPPAPRTVVPLARDKPVQVVWTAKNLDKATEWKDVVVHFFVVKEDKLGQRETPPLNADVAYEGALTMDFKPAEKASWQFQLKLREEGSYLLRVETIGLLQPHRHEHFAALDLDVK